MLARMVLVIALVVVVGFGAAKIFALDGNTRVVAELSEQLDAALGADSTVTRWYDIATTIGLVAGGAVFVVGVMVVASMRSKAL